MIDPDGVGPHGDELSGIGEIGENSPNEPNFDETASSVEPQESIQVTANSGAPSGLDKGVVEPAEGSTPEQGEASGSASATSNPKPATPDSSDRAIRGRLPATVSKRQKGRSRREKKRAAAETMVEDKLSAGNFSLGEILTSALALPLPGGRGP